MWSDVYNNVNNIDKITLTAWDLRNLYQKKLEMKASKSLLHTQNVEKNSSPSSTRYNVCYKQLAIGIYGPAAPITVASWDTPCSHTALVRAYSDYVIRRMNLQVHM